MTGKGKFEFPDKIGTKKIPTIGETQKNDDRNFGKVDAVQPTYENKHTSNNANIDENKTQGKTSFSDFEKLREDIIVSIDNKLNFFNKIFDSKMDEINKSISTLDNVISKLNENATTYNQINVLIEDSTKNTKQYIIDSKESLEKDLSSIKNLIIDEVEKNEDFIKKYLTKDNAEVSTKNNYMKTEETVTKDDVYDEDEDDEEEEPFENKKKTRNKDSDENKKPFLFRILKKMGM